MNVSYMLQRVIIVIAILVAAIVLFRAVYKPSAEPPGGIVPELEVSGTKTVSSTKVSGYVMRYEYEVGTFLGDNIDFDITIKTQGGFEELSLDGLNVYRYTKDGDTRIELSSPPLEIRNIKNYGAYTVTFTGASLKRDAVPPAGGKNFFEVRAVRDGTEVSGDDKIPDVLVSTVDGVMIEQGDLNYTLKDSVTNSFPWIVTDASSFQAGVGMSVTTEYELSIIPDKNVKITYDDPTTKSMFVFTYVKSPNEKFTVEGKSVFKLGAVLGEKNMYYLYTVDVPDSKIVTKDADGNIVLKKPDEMDAAMASVARVTIKDMGAPPAPPPPPPAPPPPETFTVQSANKVHVEFWKPKLIFDKTVALTNIKKIKLEGTFWDQGWGGRCSVIMVHVNDKEVAKFGPDGWWGEASGEIFRPKSHKSWEFDVDVPDANNVKVYLETYGGGCALNVENLVLTLS